MKPKLLLITREQAESLGLLELNADPSIENLRLKVRISGENVTCRIVSSPEELAAKKPEIAERFDVLVVATVP